MKQFRPKNFVTTTFHEIKNKMITPRILQQRLRFNFILSATRAERLFRYITSVDVATPPKAPQASEPGKLERELSRETL